MNNLIRWQEDNLINIKFARQTKRVWSYKFNPSSAGLPGTPFVKNVKGTLHFVIDGWPVKERVTGLIFSYILIWN